MVSMHSCLVSVLYILIMIHSEVGVMRYLYDSKSEMVYFPVKAHPVVYEPLWRLRFRHHEDTHIPCDSGLCDQHPMKLV